MSRQPPRMRPGWGLIYLAGVGMGDAEACLELRDTLSKDAKE